MRRPYRSKDGHVAVLPYSDRQWNDFFAIAGRPDLGDDPRFADHGTRTEHVHAIYGLLAELIAEKTTDEWLALCETAQIPAMPVLSLDDVFADPHLADVGLFEHHDHPSEGAIVMTRPAVGYSESPASIRRGAPRFGQQGGEILAELGYDEAAVAALAASGALAGEWK
jgi:formyl-CoA transferase